MTFELYDRDDAHLIATYRDEADALAEVAAQIGAFGRDAVRTWTLLRSSPDGARKENVAEGDALAERALHAHAGAA